MVYRGYVHSCYQRNTPSTLSPPTQHQFVLAMVTAAKPSNSKAQFSKNRLTFIRIAGAASPFPVPAAAAAARAFCAAAAPDRANFAAAATAAGKSSSYKDSNAW